MSDPKQFIIRGDINVYPADDIAAEGPGSILMSGTSSVLDVEGETFLDKTNIDTTDGIFAVTGTNKVSFAPTSAGIEMTGGALSFFKTTAGNLQVDAQAGTLDLDGNAVTIDSDTAAVGITGQTGVNVSSTTGNIAVSAAATLDLDATTSILVDTSGQISLDANAGSNFTVTGGGNLTVNSLTGRAIIEGGANTANAVTITSTNAAGGIDMDAGSGGFNLLATDGAFSIVGQNNSSQITLQTDGAAQDLTIGVTGAFNSSLILQSAGTGADSILINSTDTAGGIDINSGTSGITVDTTGGISLDAQGISNFTTTGAFDLTISSTAGSTIVSGGEAVADAVQITAGNIAGGVDINAGTGGIAGDTTGSISLDAQAASNFTTTGAFDLTVNSTAGSVILEGGEAVIDAVQIRTSNAAGGIDIDAGTGGVTLDSTGGISLDAVGSSNFTTTAGSPGNDLTISLVGANDSSIILSSQGTGTDAIKLNATGGGIDIDSAGPVRIDTTDTVNGIEIGTATAGVNVTIGTSTSSITIPGDLTIGGTQTIINTETLTVEDNVIVVNSGNGELGVDAGIIFRRFQTPNDAGTGDVVNGTAAITSAFQAGSSTPATLILNAAASATDDFYNGWWIKITSGTGVDQVRRIKDYVGASKTATIYVTADNTATFADGLDLATAPAAADTYELFSCPFAASFYDESTDRYKLVCTSLSPDPVSAVGVSTVSIQEHLQITTGGIDVEDDGTPANSYINVNNINEFTLDEGVTIEGVLIKDGTISGLPTDGIEIVELLDNATTAVDIVATDTIGSFFITVDAVQSNSGVGATTRLSTGAYATFVAAKSSANVGTDRLASATGSANQKLDIEWNTGQKIRLKHRPAFTGGVGSLIPYRVRTLRSIS